MKSLLVIYDYRVAIPIILITLLCFAFILTHPFSTTSAINPLSSTDRGSNSAQSPGSVSQINGVSSTPEQTVSPMPQSQTTTNTSTSTTTNPPSVSVNASTKTTVSKVSPKSKPSSNQTQQTEHKTLTDQLLNDLPLL